MKRNNLLFALCVLISLTITGCATENKTYEKELFLMDTILNIRIFDGDGDGALEEIEERLVDIDEKFNRESKNSEIYKINENAGIKAYTPSADVYGLIEDSLEYANITDGAFNPTIGAIADLWDIGKSGTERKTIPTDGEIKESLAYTDFNNVELKNGEVFITKEGTSLDLGGIVKGYAADEIIKIFNKYNIKSAIIDLGGNIYVHGSKMKDRNWNVGVADPKDPDKSNAVILSLKDISCVTSGAYERYDTYKGKVYHHIFDSKTGYPSDNGVLSVTILSKSSEICDMLSTAAFILGVDEGSKLVGMFEDTEALFINTDNEMIATKGFEKYIKKDTLKEEFKLEVLGE